MYKLNNKIPRFLASWETAAAALETGGTEEFLLTTLRVLTGFFPAEAGGAAVEVAGIFFPIPAGVVAGDLGAILFAELLFITIRESKVIYYKIHSRPFIALI